MEEFEHGNYESNNSPEKNALEYPSVEAEANSETNNSSQEMNTEIPAPQDISPVEFQEQPKKTEYKTNSTLFHFLAAFGVCFMAFFFLCQVYLHPISVVGWSMLPNVNTSALSDTDEEHIDTVFYRKASAYNYGDMVIVSNLTQKYIDSNKVSYVIKRVAALPNTTITFYVTNSMIVMKNSGEISQHAATRYYYSYYITDESGNKINPVIEDYIKEDMFFEDDMRSIFDKYNELTAALSSINGTYSITLANNEYFVMGDNRNNSTDSRFFGAIGYDDIEGNVRLHVKYGGNIWFAIIDRLKQLLSATYITLRG